MSNIVPFFDLISTIVPIGSIGAAIFGLVQAVIAVRASSRLRAELSKRKQDTFKAEHERIQKEIKDATIKFDR